MNDDEVLAGLLRRILTINSGDEYEGFVNYGRYRFDGPDAAPHLTLDLSVDLTADERAAIERTYRAAGFVQRSALVVDR